VTDEPASRRGHRPDPPVAADFRRQQRHVPLQARPDHLRLQSTVEQHGIEQPLETICSGHAEAGLRGPQQRRDPALVHPLDRADPLEQRTVEEQLPVGVVHAHRERSEILERRRVALVHAGGAQLHHRAVVAATAVCVRDRHLKLVLLARCRGDAHGGAAVDGHPVQKADLAQPAHLAARAGERGSLGHQLHRHREREHGVAVHAVVVEVAIARELELAYLLAFAQQRLPRRGRQAGGRADHHLGFALAPAAELLLEHAAALLDRNQRDAASRELALQLRRHHA
jgi:hypothetical protein